QVARAALLYAAAWRVQQHWQIAGSLGHAEVALGRYRDAAEHLALFLRETHDAASVDPRERAALARDFEAARARAGTVDVSAPAGAELLVDGALVGTAPLGAPLFVEPGKHFFDARLAGYRAHVEVRELAPGASADVAVRLAPVAPPPPPAPPPPDRRAAVE